MAPRKEASGKGRLILSGLQSLFPILTAFKDYNPKRDLVADLVAGTTNAILHIPQGMAYGLLAGVDPIDGLYVSFVPVLVTAIMSQSRHVSYGTFAVLSMILASATGNIKQNLALEMPDMEMPSNIEILTAICLVAGLVQASMAIIKLGALSLVFSDQLISGFTCAAAVHVLSSQLAPVFDLPMDSIPNGPFRIRFICWSFVQGMLAGNFNKYTAMLSIASILFLVFIKELVEPQVRKWGPSCLPSEIILMAIATYVSSRWRFNEVYGVAIVGDVPSSLPKAQVPRFDLVPAVFEDALTAALIAYTMNLSLAQLYAKKFNYKVDANQELLALGVANIVASFFSCFPCANSLTRSAVQGNLNPRSPLSSLLSCALVVVIICFFSHVFHDLPVSTLSCIIFVALKGILMLGKDLKENWLRSKLDALVWLATFLFTLAFDVTHGLILGILVSLVVMFFRLLKHSCSTLGQVPGTEMFVDIAHGPIDCSEIQQVKILKFNSALCYLNRLMFKGVVEKSVSSRKSSLLNALRGLSCSKKRKHLVTRDQELNDQTRIKFLVIDLSSLSFWDASGASSLIEIVEELSERDVQVYLTGCPVSLADIIQKLDTAHVMEQHMFSCLTDAVRKAKYLTRNAQIGAQQKPYLIDHTPLEMVLSFRSIK